MVMQKQSEQCLSAEYTDIKGSIKNIHLYLNLGDTLRIYTSIAVSTKP